MKNFATVSTVFVTGLILLGAFLILPLVTIAQATHSNESKIIAKGATLNQVAKDYIFTEGPAVDEEGNVVAEVVADEAELRLIAAAQELLLACELALVLDPTSLSCRKELEYVIRKAKGTDND